MRKRDHDRSDEHGPLRTLVNGMKHWNRPGSAMLAVIPYLDPKVEVNQGREAGLFR